jgi:hypothetical protein
LLSAIRRDRLIVSSQLARTSASRKFPLRAPAYPFERKSGEQKSAKPRESCQVLQNEHLQKSSHNSREMNTYKIIGLKVEQNEHLQKKRGGWTVGSDPFAITTDRAMINVP